MPQWWSANWNNRVSFAAKHPSYAVRTVLRDRFAADERFLAALADATIAEIRQFLGDRPRTTDTNCDWLPSH